MVSPQEVQGAMKNEIFYQYLALDQKRSKIWP